MHTFSLKFKGKGKSKKKKRKRIKSYENIKSLSNQTLFFPTLCQYAVLIDKWEFSTLYHPKFQESSHFLSGRNRYMTLNN